MNQLLPQCFRESLDDLLDCHTSIVLKVALVSPHGGDGMKYT